VSKRTLTGCPFTRPGAIACSLLQNKLSSGFRKGIGYDVSFDFLQRAFVPLSSPAPGPVVSSSPV
jgi:hypothetical protein